MMPALFVLLWSTGFIVAKYAVPHAPPLIFLSYRLVGAVLVLLPIAWALRAPWPRNLTTLMHAAVAGILLHAGYLGGVWAAISMGMPAGVSALIVGTQPIVTALAASVVGERASARQWLGLALGFAGIALVLSDRLTLQGVGLLAISLNVLALVTISAGTLYQKRFCGAIDLRTGTIVQFIASFIVLLPIALAFESPHVDFSFEFWAALAWSVVALSVVAIMLLFIMIRRGRATEVASYMYLTPPMTAVLAWLLFDEKLAPMAIVGVALAMLGVAIVIRRGRAA